MTAEVVGTLERAGVASLVLKGPGTAELVLGDGLGRSYGDSDLLVSPGDQPVAEAVLAELGFVRQWGPVEHADMESPPANPWTRDAMSVDLHAGVPGIGLEPAEAFALLAGRATVLPVGGRSVPVPDVGDRLVHLALHAWHHGPGHPGPLRDLERACALRSRLEWEGAARAATGLEAAAPFAVGLSLVPGGERLLGELGLQARPTAAWLLRMGGVPMAAGLDRLATTPGLSARLRLLRDEAFPSPDFLRWSSPIARRPRGGLAVAYLTRIVLLAWRAGPALREWWRIRAAA